MATYILQKDTPFGKAGAEVNPSTIGMPFTKRQADIGVGEGMPYFYCVGDCVAPVFNKKIVEEDDGTWFKLKEGRPFKKPGEDFKSIKIDVSDVSDVLSEDIKAMQSKHRYTEEDMRKCFEHNKVFTVINATYPNGVVETKAVAETFEDYLQSLNK